MKRDMNLVRALLLNLEGVNIVELTEYSEEQIVYHKAMLIDAKLAHGEVTEDENGHPSVAGITHLTWKGHEFIDASRDDAIWKKAMKTFQSLGISATLPVLHSLLETQIRKTLGL